MKLSQYGFNSVLFQWLLKTQRTFLLFNILRYIYTSYNYLLYLINSFSLHFLSPWSLTFFSHLSSSNKYSFKPNQTIFQIPQTFEHLFFFLLRIGRRKAGEVSPLTFSSSFNPYRPSHVSQHYKHRWQRQLGTRAS